MKPQYGPLMSLMSCCDILVPANEGAELVRRGAKHPNYSMKCSVQLTAAVFIFSSSPRSAFQFTNTHVKATTATFSPLHPNITSKPTSLMFIKLI